MRKRILSAVLTFSMILSFVGAAPVPILSFEPEDENIHEHSFACYEDYNLTCKENHSHSASCFEHNGELICGIDEGVAHMHNEDGYECHLVGKVLTCTTQEHTHSDECYSEEEIPLSKVELPETGFTEEFYPSEEEETIDENIEQKEELPEIPSMGEEIFESEQEELPESTLTDEKEIVEKVLSCELGEHIHDESCYTEIWECRKLVVDNQPTEESEKMENSGGGGILSK